MSKTKIGKISLSSASALFVAMSLWGLSGPVDKYIMDQNVPFIVLLTVKYVIAAVFFTLIYKPRNITVSPYIKELVIKSIINSVQILMITIGISKVAGINYAMLSALGPILLFSTSIFILHDKFRFRILLGLVVALVGISLVILTEDHSGGSVTGLLQGNVLITGALVINTIATIIGKHLTSEMNPKSVAGFSLAWNAITYLTILALVSHKIDFTDISGRSWVLLAINGFVLVFIPWILYYIALEKTTIDSLSVFVYISPAVAALGSVVILGETFTLSLLAGAALVFTGLWLSQHEAKIFWLHIHIPHKYISPLHLHLKRR